MEVVVILGHCPLLSKGRQLLIRSVAEDEEHSCEFYIFLFPLKASSLSLSSRGREKNAQIIGSESVAACYLVIVPLLPARICFVHASCYALFRVIAFLFFMCSFMAAAFWQFTLFLGAILCSSF